MVFTLVMQYYLETTGYGYSKILCTNISFWFLNKFLPRHKINVEIWHHGLKGEGVWGYCDIVGKCHKPREFLIEIQSNLDKEDYIKTLLHEYVHLEDFCKGNLIIKSSKRYYNGIDLSSLNYNEQPHEMRANYLEEILYQDFIKSIDP